MKQIPAQHTVDIEKQLLDRLALQVRILPIKILWRYWSRDFIAMSLLAVMLSMAIGSPIWLIVYGDIPFFFQPVVIFVTLVFVFRSAQISRRAMEIEAGIGSWRGSLEEVHFLNDVQAVNEVLSEYSLLNRDAVWGMIEILNNRKTTNLLKEMKDFWRFFLSLGVGLLISWAMLDIDVTNQGDRHSLRTLIVNILCIVVMVESFFVAIPLIFESGWAYRKERLIHVLRRIHLSVSSDPPSHPNV